MVVDPDLMVLTTLVVALVETLPPLPWRYVPGPSVLLSNNKSNDFVLQ